jgi:hypothetical protein
MGISIVVRGSLTDSYSHIGWRRRSRPVGAGQSASLPRSAIVSKQSTPDRDALPLPDYDHLTLGELPTRIGGLDAQALSELVAYERGHGNRLPVVQILEHRLDAVKSGAEPTSADPAASTPTSKDSPSGGSKVSPQTSGPPVNPPSHGDPTNPAQPRG